MTDSTTYVCGCGHEFDESLGAYGCPNCEGDEGPAVLHTPAVGLYPLEIGRYEGVRIIEQTHNSIRNVKWLSREEFEKEYPAKFIGMDTASGPDRTAVRFQLPRKPLFTHLDRDFIERRLMDALFEREFVAAFENAHETGYGTGWFRFEIQEPQMTLIATAIKEIYK